MGRIGSVFHIGKGAERIEPRVHFDPTAVGLVDAELEGGRSPVTYPLFRLAKDSMAHGPRHKPRHSVGEPER